MLCQGSVTAVEVTHGEHVIILGQDDITKILLSTVGVEVKANKSTGLQGAGLKVSAQDDPDLPVVPHHGSLQGHGEGLGVKGGTASDGD